MHPVLFSIGPISFYSYGILVSVGFFISVILLIRLIEKASLNLQFIADYFFALIIISLIGARLFYIFFYWSEFAYDIWKIFYFWEGGYSVWGGIIAFLSFLYYYSRKNQEDYVLWLSVFVPAGFLWAFFDSVAAFLDGKDFGVQTSLPWGIQFDNPAMPFAGVLIHPTQLYSALFFVIVFFWMRSIWKKKKDFPRLMGYWGISLYASFMFLIDFLHGDFVPYFFGLKATQAPAILIAILFLVFYLLERRRSKLY